MGGNRGVLGGMSALMLVSFAVVHFPFMVSIYFSVPSLLIISERRVTLSLFLGTKTMSKLMRRQSDCQ